MMVVLQPSLSERTAMTEREADLFRRVKKRFGSLEQLQEAHAAVRAGLGIITSQTNLEVLDASRLFEDERETTFTDLWHFSDPGHALLADAIAERLVPLILAGTEERD